MSTNLEHCMQLEIKRPTGSSVVAHLTGRLNLEGAPKIQGPLLGLAGDPQIRLMVLDLAAVPMLGSAGIRLFIYCAKTLQEHQGKLVLLSPQRFVREVLEISGISNYLPLVESFEDALALVDE